MSKTPLTTLVLAVVLGVPLAPHPADAAEDFYKGKTFTVLVGLAAGAGTDLDARVISRYMVKYLPGQPTLVVQNMPGAGGLAVTNHLYSVAPKDGTVVAVTQRGVATVPLFAPDTATFDATKFNWIGSRSGEVSLGAVWHTVPIASIRDVLTRETVVGSTGGGADTHMIPLIFNATLGTKFKVVSGYAGGSEINVAIERGEVEGRLGWSYNAMISTKADWMRDKKIKIISQLSLEKHPLLPDVPIALDLATDDGKRQALRIFAARQEIGFPMIAPPDLPAERVNQLRRAFDAVMKDPEYLKEAEKMQVDVDPRTGEKLQQLVAEINRTPRTVVDSARALLKAQGVELQ